MPARLLASSDEQLLCPEALECLRDTVQASGSAVVLCAKASLVTRAEVELANAGITFGVSCSTPTSWAKLRWDLYGDGRTIVSSGVRSVLMTRLLEGDVDPLDKGPGTVDVLCKLAQNLLPWLPQLSQESLELTMGEATAVDVCLRYANELYVANMVEGVEAQAKLPALMAAQVSAMPAFVLVGFERFDYATRIFVAELAKVANVMVCAQADDGPASACVRTSLAELAAQLGGLAVGQGAALSVAPVRAPELQALVRELFNPQNAPLDPGSAVELIEPAGPLAQPLAVVEHLSKLASQGVRNIVVVSPDAQEAWHTLAPKLCERGFTVRAQLSIPAPKARYVASFMRFACEVARLDTLARTWPELGTDTYPDMSWWPPLAIEDFLLLALNGLDVTSVWRRDARWRGNRILTPAQVLATLENKDATSELVAQVTRDIRAGHIAAAAGRILRSLEPQEEEELAQREALKQDETPASPSAQSSIPEQISAEQALMQAQDYASLMALVKVGGALKDAAITTQSADVALSNLLLYAQNILRTMGVTYGPELVGSLDCTVTIINPSAAATLPPCTADALVYMGLDSISSSIPAQGGTFENLVVHLGAERAQEPLDAQRIRFANIVRIPTAHLAFVKPIFDASAEKTYPAVMLQEVLACYHYLTEKNKDAYTLVSAAATHLDEGLVEENLSAASSYPEAYAVAGASAAGQLVSNFKRFVVVPRDGEDATEEQKPSLSASQIETYLECPFKWFTLRRLALGDCDATFSPMQMGTFAHRVLEVTHRSLMLSAAEQAGLVSAELANNPRNAAPEQGELFYFDPTVRLEGSRVSAANLEHAQQLLTAEFDVHLEHQYADGRRISDQALIPHTQQELRQLSVLKQDLLDTLAYEADKFAGFEPRLFEGRFGGKSNKRVSYAGADIVGTIDRVDVDAQGRAIVIDYKHKSSLFDEYALVQKGASRFDEAFTLPRRVQTLMYASIAQELLKDTGIEVVGAVYLGTKGNHQIAGALSPRDAEAVVHPGTLNESQLARITLPVGGASSFSDLLKRTEEELAGAVERMKAGYIETAPSRPEACKYCPVLNCERRLLASD